MYQARRDITGSRFEVRELGEIDIVPRALVILDLLTRDDERPVFSAVYLEGHSVVSCGELAGLAGGSGWVLLWRQGAGAVLYGLTS